MAKCKIKCWTMLMLIIFLVVAVWYGTRNHRYWLKKNVEYERPLPFFGNHAQSFLLRKNVLQTVSEIYWRHPEKHYVGIYRGNMPQLIVRDPDLIKDILVTNFKCFKSRGVHPCEDTIEPLLKNLFFVDGELWRILRQRLTPAFTTGKLKAMFPLIVELAEKLQARIASADRREIDVRDLMARYTTDFIGSCGFGLDSNSLDSDNSAFRKLGAKIYETTVRRSATIALKCIFPKLCGPLKFLGQELEDDLTLLVKLISNQRNNQPSIRGDFLDLMLGLSLKGVEEDNAKIGIELDDKLIAAQCFIFFAAGFETSTTATAFTLHQLAHNPNVQSKVQAEIDAVLKRDGDRLSFDAVKKMTYLEWTLMEGLRMFPPGLVVRKCTAPYTIPKTNVKLERGVKVFIPTEAIHMDPQYFEQPEEFQPERFSPEIVAVRHKFVYLPFGQGPRNCIGKLVVISYCENISVLLVCQKKISFIYGLDQHNSNFNFDQ